MELLEYKSLGTGIKSNKTKTKSPAKIKGKIANKPIKPSLRSSEVQRKSFIGNATYPYIRRSGGNVVVECTTCGKRTDANVVGTHQYHDAAEGPPCRITLLACSRCQHAILIREEERWTDMWSSPETLHPGEQTCINPDLPEHLRCMFREATTCYRSGALTASAIMCRKAIEGLCIQHGIKARNLATALQQARDLGLIDGQLFDWADELRIAGNAAAHDVESIVSGEDARDLLELTEAILEYVFVFRDRFEAFKKRRHERLAPEPAKGAGA